MTYPVFASGDVLNASDMNAVGLWLVKTQTVGSGVSSVTVTSAFSSNYDAYRITFQGGTTSAGANIGFQLAGITSSTYQMYGYYGTWGVATINGYSPAVSTNWTDLSPSSTTSYAWQMDLHNPFLSVAKFGRSWGWSSTSGVHELSLRCTSTSSATGFTLTPLSGTMTGGTIRVYGYKNS